MLIEFSCNYIGWSYPSSNNGFKGLDGVGYTYSNMSTPNATAFVPKVTFTKAPLCFKPETVTATPAGHVTWTGEGTTWNLNYKAGSDAAWTEINGITAMSYDIPELAANTACTVRVQNVCEDNSTTDWTTATFTTLAAIPLVEPFASSSIPTGWSRYTGLLSDVMAGTATLSSGGGWSFSTGNGVFDNHAKANIYNTGRTYWLVAPTLPMQDNVQLSFDLALTKYNGTLDPVTPGLQEDDKFVVLITTDGGDSWTILRQWDNAGSEYVYDNIACSAVGQNVTIDLSGYAGQNIAVAFYGESTVATSGSDNNLHIDNVSIDYIPSCAKPTGLAKSNVAAHTVDLSWTSDASAWVVAYKASEDEEFTEVNVTENPYTLPGLTPETAYTAKVRANCGGAYSDWTNVVSFTTTVACPAPTGLTTVPDGYDAIFSWTGSADGYDVAFADNEDADPEDNIVDNNFTETNYTQYDLELGDYYFWVRANCGDEGFSSWAGPKKVHIGYCVPTTSNVDGQGISNVNFGTSDNIVNNNTPKATYADYTDLTGAVQAGVESTIAITYNTGYDYGTIIWVDLDNNMSFEDDEILFVGMAPNSTDPFNATITIPATQTPGNYVMRIGGADSGFDSYVNGTSSTAPDACYSGNWACFQDYTLLVLEAPSCLVPTALTLSRDNDEITAVWEGTASSYNIDINGAVTNNVTSPYVFTADLATTYTVKVQTNCGGETSDWSNTQSITTPDCWGGHTIDYTLIDQYNDSWNGASISVIGDCGAYNETLTVASGASPLSGTLNLCGDYYEFIWNKGSYDGECSFTFTEGGTTLFTKPSSVSDGLVLYTIGTQSCPKPTALENEDPETHSVELSWTENGEATAWQLCVNGDEDNLIDVTENPYILENLTPETDYSVKVRAKCGPTDVSCWSESVIFTTPAVCPKPTNLTAQNPGSTSVALRWYVNGDETAWQISTGDDENPIDVVADDVSRTYTVIGGNIVTYLDYTLTGLDAETEYTVKVRANCGAEDGVSDWSNSVVFTTLASCLAPDALDVAGITAHEAEVSWNGSGESYVVSYRTAAYMNGIEEEFGSSIPTGWENKTGLLSSIMEGADFSSSTQWAFGSNNNVFDNHARINIYGGSRYGWLITPSLEVPSGATFTFDLALTAFSGSGAASGTCDDDRFVVLAYVNNAWTILREWNNSGAVDVYNEIPTAGETVTIDIADYVGQNVKFAFYGESTINNNGDNNLHIDNVAIGTPVAAGDWVDVSTSEFSTVLTPLDPETKYEFKVKALCDGDAESEYSESEFFTTTEACPVPTVLTATATNNSAVLGWTANAGESAWTVYYKKADNPDFTAVSVTENPYTVEPLEAATEYVFYVEANCSETETSVPSETFSFTTKCNAVTEFPWTENFDGLTEDNTIPTCWNNDEGTTTTNSFKWSYNTKTSGNGMATGTSHDGSNCVVFNSYANDRNNTNFLKTIPISLPSDQDMQLTFWYKNPTGGDLSVYISTDGGETYETALATGLTDASSWTMHDAIDLSDYAGEENVVIVFKGTSNYANGDAYIYLDDVKVEEIPNCVTPTDLAATNITTNSAELSWTANSGETSWTVYYNTYINKAAYQGYTTVPDVTENPYTLEGLDPETQYIFYVEANCSETDTSAPSQMFIFSTKCNAITDFPWSEDFEDYSVGDFEDICWENEHIAGPDSYLFKVITGTTGGNTTHILQLPDQKQGNMTKLVLPLMDLPSDNYQFSLDVYRSNNMYNDSYAEEGIRVFASTNGEIEGATELAFIPRQYNVSSDEIPEEDALGWYTYTLPIGMSGDCYIILRGESQYCTFTSMDNFAVCTPNTGADSKAICSSELPYTWNGVIFNEAGVKTATLINAAGCDSVVTMTLTVNYPSLFEDVANICADDLPFVFHGVTFTEAGTNSRTLTNVAGCDSVVTLAVNVNYPSYFSDETTVCSNQLPYTFYEVVFTEAGTQNRTLTNVAGCDSVMTLTVNVNQTSSFSDETSICDNQLPFLFHGVTFTEAGTDNRTLTNVAGCDSVVTLTVNVKYRSYFSDEISVCAADMPYTFYGVQFETAGTQTKTIPNAAGCDSIMTLTVNVKQPTSFTDTKTVCAEDMPVDWYGHLFTQAGTQTFHSTNAVGCDSTSTLTLYVNTPVHQSYTVDACDSYKWVVGSWSQTYTTGGDKLYSHNDANGCLQVDTLHLTLGHSTTGVDVVTGECDSYTWIDGKTYTSSNNTATYTLTNAAGCDSVVTLNLTLGHTNPTAYRITECNSYTWINGTTYDHSDYATYAHENETGCIDVDTLYLTINYSKTTDIYDTVCLGNAYNKNGFNIRMADIVEGDQLATLNLHTVHECDSTVTLHLHAKICDELCGQPVEDIDQNSYGTMAVHHLCWMTSNLRTTRYADETPIPFAIVYSYPYNPENTENLMTYGRLYNWASASKADATPMQGACPDGWRLPTQAEFDQLSLYYSESQLRSTDNWAQNAGTNESGFNKQPAGFYNATTGRCERLHATTHFYTADFEANNPIYQVTNYHCDEVHYEVTNNPLDGRSIRCVRDLVSQ